MGVSLATGYFPSQFRPIWNRDLRWPSTCCTSSPVLDSYPFVFLYWLCIRPRRPSRVETRRTHSSDLPICWGPFRQASRFQDPSRTESLPAPCPLTALARPKRPLHDIANLPEANNVAWLLYMPTELRLLLDDIVITQRHCVA